MHVAVGLARAGKRIGAEERGQAESIAKNLMEMSRLKTPIISIVTVLTLLLVVVCGAYYGASVALGALTSIELPP